MKELFHNLKAYGEVVADKEHKTTEGYIIRFTTYKLNGELYVATMCDGEVIIVGKMVNE